jgi:ribonuclease HI
MIVSLNDLLASVDCPRWDLLLAGDGSGTQWDKPAGWAVVSIDRQSGERKAFVGGVNSGTVNRAEASCYLHALAYDFNHRQNHKLLTARHVIIFSDSQVTVNTGNGTYSPSTNNPDLWHAYDFFRQQGYRITFYLIPRNSNPLHVAVDTASRAGDILEAGTAWLVESVYDLLPWVTPHDPKTLASIPPGSKPPGSV